MGRPATDFTGQTYGNLTFIKRTDRKSGTNFLWEVLCGLCGNIFIASPRTIIPPKNNPNPKKKRRTSCGCCTKPFRYAGKDFTDMKVYRLTFRRKTSKDANGRQLWEAECECGTLIEIVPSCVKKGGTMSCGCLRRETNSKNGENVRVHAPSISTARAVWGVSYSDGCDFETFLTLSQQLCFYCGKKPSYTRNIALEKKLHNLPVSEYAIRDGYFTYNGLDRVDSTKDHSPNNIVPCCWTCNWMKRNLSVDEFKAHITRIHAHMRIRSNSEHFAAANEITAIFAAI